MILVTNDDGISAPGIIALAETMKQLGEVVVHCFARHQSIGRSCAEIW